MLNATPDSFSGDGLAGDIEALVERGRRHVAEGAAMLDVGGESTRPGAVPVPEDEELARVLPAVERLAREIDATISIDTMKPGIAEAALLAGATMVNDVSGLVDPRLADVAARQKAWLVVTHNGWTHPTSEAGADIVEVVVAELERLVGLAVAAGVPPERVIVDPGLGFGKAPPESLALLRRISEVRQRLRPHPVLVGPSRKGFIGWALGVDVSDRLEGTLACVAVAAYAGAEIIRVHDVAPAVRVARMAAAIAGRTHR